MNNHSDTCGLFGKTPQQADFISHHLPNEFTEYWHSWLQSSISVSREQLGDHWLDCYLTSPVWRFAIMSDIITNPATTGLFIPSIDEVGRYFPLTLAHMGQHQPWSAYLYGKEWYRTLQEVALYALEENTSYTQFIKQFEALPNPAFPLMPDYKTHNTMQTFKHNHVILKPTDKTPGQLALSLLANAYGRTLGQYSLWWTEGSEIIEPCLLISAGLPDPGQFSAMLDGDWQRWGWSQEMVVPREEQQTSEGN